MTPQPLSDAEFEMVHEILERFGAKHAMNLEQLDGLLAALVCVPDDVPQSEYLREVWGDDMVNEDTFAAQPILQEFVGLIERHRGAIAHTLQTGDVFMPLLLEDEQGVALGNDWANGFLRGMGLRKEDWAPLVDDEDSGGSLVPIFALAHEHDPDPKMRPYQERVSAELREKLIAGIIAGVVKIYRYFQEQKLNMQMVVDSTTYRRFAPKVGRNEPCPCGSGRKFKHCCGRVTLH